MINVIVTYTVEDEFVATNKENIRLFLKEFEKLENERFSYQVLLQEDGQTFVHISKYADKEIQEKLLNLPQFLIFQKQRDDSGLLLPPVIQTCEFIGSKGKF